MLAMPRKKLVRDLYFVNGKTITEIAHDTGHDRKTVRKVINTDDWNELAPSFQGSAKSKIDPFKETIDGWLANDKRANLTAHMKQLTLMFKRGRWRYSAKSGSAPCLSSTSRAKRRPISATPTTMKTAHWRGAA